MKEKLRPGLAFQQGGNNAHKVGNKGLIVLWPALGDTKKKILGMGYELCLVWVHNQLPTSDSQIGGGLRFTHTVLCEAREGSLINHWCFLYPQKEVVFFISNVIPGDREEQWQQVK